MNNKFDEDKKIYLGKLYKPDKSKKGNVDKQIIPLIDEINKNNNYYTTSSCAGRTVLISQPKSKKKNETHWYYVSHKESDPKDIINALKQIKGEDEVWFRTEGVIIHICARDLESANKLVKLCKLAGFKRSGIFSMTNNRIIIEALTPEHIDAPIYNKKQLVEDKYIDFLTIEGNKKLKEARQRAKKLQELIKDLK